ncbi:MAG: type II toxin-antitoxin system RelE/ParE family toxin [Candidatus Levyibacteriota bacterium]
MDKIEWDILTYESSRAEKPVDNFIKKQQPQARAKIIHKVRLLKSYGNLLGMPHAKLLGEGLYELRIRGKEELRIFYFFKQAKTIMLLHGFKKQKQETPQNELQIAKTRMKELTTV